MDNITKEEYLEAVSKGAEKAFTEKLEGFFSPGSAFKAVIVEGTERAVTFMLTKEDQLVDNGFLRAFKDGLCQAIKEQLMKGEPPCKATPGENND